MTTEKRSIDKQLQFNVSVIIVDIEGTTTSINFVKETLFPYAREHLEEYIKSNWSEKELQEDVALLREQANKDVTDKVEGAVSILDGDNDEAKSSVIKNVIWQMDNDRKTKALKQLQGHIWRSGYKSGKLVGHIYDDVKECLKTWTEAGKKIFVYSSGSVEAQKLLFGNTKDGDLLPMFSGYFDTEVGAKTESASYTKILDKLRESSNLGQDTKDVLFLTDVLKEAQAAVEAGIQAVIVSREGNAPIPDDIGEKFSIVDSFSDLIFEGNAKRRKLSDITEKIDNNDESKNGIISEGGNKDVEMEVCTNSNSTPATESVDGKKEEDTKSAESDSKGDGVSSTENSKSEVIETNGDLKKDTTGEKKEGIQSEDDKQTVDSSLSVTTTTTDSKTKENSSNEPTDSISTSTDADVTMEEPKTDDKDKGSIVKEHPKNEDNVEKEVVKSDADKPINNTTESADVEMNVEEKKEVGEVENKSTVNGLVSESKKDTPTDSNTESNDVEMKLEDSKEAGDDGISNVINENIENEKTVEIKPDLPEKNESKDKEEDKTVVKDVKEPELETNKVEESTNEVKPDDKKSEKVEELETNNKEESKNEAVSVAEPVTAKDKTDDKKDVVENKTEEKQEVTSSEIVNVDKKVEESQSGELKSKEKDVKMEEKNDSEVTSSKSDEEKQVVENSEVKVDNKETKVTEDSSDKKITDVEMTEDNKVDSSKTDSEVLKVDSSDKIEDKNEKTDNNETSKSDKVENKETENKTEATNGIDKVTNGNHEGKNGITDENCDNSKTADETNNIKEKIAEKIKENNENCVEPVAGEV